MYGDGIVGRCVHNHLHHKTKKCETLTIVVNYVGLCGHDNIKSPYVGMAKKKMASLIKCSRNKLAYLIDL